jgi:uncharacterized protein YndB with AHSA1/START domain
MEQAGIKQIELELTIDAPREHAWKCLFSNFGDWWPQDFLCLEGSEKIQFEPFAGGRVYEETPDGHSILWAHVYSIVPGKSIDFIGHMTPSYGGPSLTMWRISLHDAEGSGKTTMKLTDTILGRIAEDHQANLNEGWTYLFNSYKAYCESDATLN